MKVFTTLVLALLACNLHLSAQASFSLTPQSVTTSVHDTITDGEGTNNIKNLSAVSKTIRWTRTVICIDPDTALSQVCDANLCYAPPVSTKTFTLAPNATAPMIVHFLKDYGVHGSAIIAMHYENTGNASDSLTSMYIFNTCTVTGTSVPLPEANVELYPNPVTDFFALRHDEAVKQIRVYASNGRQVASFTATPGTQYSLKDQPAGMYYVALFDGNRNVFQVVKVSH